MGVNAVPAVSLPKGGGAIRGIGEKFATNPVTGTGGLTIPLPMSPGRGKQAPQLSLTYDSGSGNGPFGFGWSLSLPRITRKTDKGLPQYGNGRDGAADDVYILSGSEDLVPALDMEGDGAPVMLDEPPFAPGFVITRYRPRIEGAFARIERWTRKVDGDTRWRSITRDNVTSWYGTTPESRIADPSDASRVFSWLICETHDDRGNATLFRYAAENADDVDAHALHERNRDAASRTAERYLKRVLYGNRTSQLVQPDLSQTTWMFEVVLDYGEHDADAPTPHDAGTWLCRNDPFSSYRASFEVRTYRLCQRVLMFHHFPDASGVGRDCLVRSVDFAYRDIRNDPDDGRRGHPNGSFIASAAQNGFRRDPSGTGYLKRSMPPLEFEYSLPEVDQEVRALDHESLENMPVGLDNVGYQWVDLDGEGVSGILSEQASGWFYKRNLSPIDETVDADGTRRPKPRFGPVELIASRPAASLVGDGAGGDGGAHLLDLAGDGQLDLAMLDAPVPGFFERGDDVLYEPTGRSKRWVSFRPFSSRVTTPSRDPNARFIDLDGDGLTDLLITEDEVLRWHPSLGEAGFGPAQHVQKPLDDERGARLLFADPTQSIYLADMSGDGMTDLVRVRNAGDVCYWPNLGYGRFGAKVAMDNAPLLDRPDQFDQRRVRLADIDGSGCNDLIYLGRDAVWLYFNESGNGFANPVRLDHAPAVDDATTVATVDLLGTGTACLVWSSPLPGAARSPVHYIDLMSGRKPHLLIGVVNNLGAETHVRYATSTKFYLQDRLAGKPWVTRLAFPVQVVERVETFDRISRSRFVTRYAYHHGHFDGDEREFRGFGMVEQFDTEQFAALSDDSDFPTADNDDAASHVPPVVTRTWFHTGAFLDAGRISNYFAGTTNADDAGEYYREPGLTDEQAAAMLLDDTPLPAGLPADEQGEACRALKGSILRQETYGLDGSASEGHPYLVSERNYHIRSVQPRGPNRHAVFFVHPSESLERHYERDPSDPRTLHAIALEVDQFGNELQSASIAYGRRAADPELTLAFDVEQQTTPQVTCAETRFTNSIESDGDAYRLPLPAEVRTYELTGYAPSGPDGRYLASDFVKDDLVHPGRLALVFDAEVQYERSPAGGARERRLIEDVRTRYRPDDFGAAQNDASHLLDLGVLEPLALAGESYKLAFTPGLIANVFKRQSGGLPAEDLLPTPADVLAATGVATGDRGGYVDVDGDGSWWIPAGRVFLSAGTNDSPATERAAAIAHFFAARRYRDPFGAIARVTFDADDLLLVETNDPVGNRVTTGTRDAADAVVDDDGNDYRVLQPRRACDANRNVTEVAFDALGMVVGTAARGKLNEGVGDSLASFDADLDEATVLAHLAAPLADPHSILGTAGARMVYDPFAYYRTRTQADPAPAAIYAMTRETHEPDLEPGQQSSVRHTLTYSDGFGREIQTKAIAEPGPLGGAGPDVSPRWIGSGWTIFNNKGKPVRKYEPFFAATHAFEFARQVGVSPVVFYDPVERVVATLHPNHTYEKVVFGPWRQESWDVNDNCALADPSADPDVGGYFVRLPPDDYLPTWHALRTDPTNAAAAAARWPDPRDLAAEARAAALSAKHADTPTVAHQDVLGRTFLTIARNKFDRTGAGGVVQSVDERYAARVAFDIEGNQRELRDAVVQDGDALGRIVMRYDYDVLGNRIHQSSMEAGERWMLSDVTGKPIRAWDSRAHTYRTEYDPARRPIRTHVLGADPTLAAQEVLVERLAYGEQHPDGPALNLRGKLYLHLDQAGSATTEAFDFKGNPLRASRRLTSGTRYRTVVDWQPVDADHVALPEAAGTAMDLAALDAALAPVLDVDAYLSRTTYDALNRPTTTTTPHTPAMAPSVRRPRYNEAGLLDGIDVNVRAAQSGGQPVWTAFVTNVDYDAKGQRTRIDYGNGVSSFYTYDPAVFRLTQLRTQRNATLYPNDRPQPEPPSWPGSYVQNLHYAYDPAGNIMGIRDDAQQTIFFRNRRVEPSNAYVYDAIYRLIEATGREHLGQAGGQVNPPTPSDAFDGFHTGLDHPGDGKAMGTYIERYAYDEAGNIQQLQHVGTSPAATGWTRDYVYDQPSLTEPAKRSNRLGSTSVGGGNNPLVEPYRHDAHGNMTRMPHLAATLNPLAPNMHWDYKDQLAQADLPGGGVAYYVYDAAGQRIRKVCEKSPGLIEERIYLGGFEIYRTFDGAGSITLERETLHVMDEKRRVAMVETRTFGSDRSDEELTRYQLDNHLRSVSLELSESGQVITYEEIVPYGGTAYQAVRSQTQTSKRYRYTGKERDEESGLYYHGVRYYAAWLGRWTSVDPAELTYGANAYLYVRANPICYFDPDGREPEPYETAPGRPGNQPWGWFLGISAHRLIAYAYTGKHLDESSGIYTNYHDVASILKSSGLGDPTRLTPAEQNRKPDITNTVSREVFEIKPWNDEGLKAGRAQVQGYLDALNKGMGAPSGGRGNSGPSGNPFHTGSGEQGQFAVQFHGGRMVWRLNWKTTEPGVIQYKWQKTSKTDRDEIREAGEAQWADVTEQEAQAYGQELTNELDRSLDRRASLFKAMNATNLVQSIVGIVASTFLMNAMMSGMSKGTSTGVPAGQRAPTPMPAPGATPPPPAPPPLPPRSMFPPPPSRPPVYAPPP